MNLNEAKSLLDQISATDGRRVPEAMPAAWLRILGKFSYMDCQAAAEKHFEESTEWLMPAHIVRAVKSRRSQRLQSLGPIEVGRHERLDAAEEVQVVREIRQAVADGALSEDGYRWYANGGVPWSDFKLTLRPLSPGAPQNCSLGPGSA